MRSETENRILEIARAEFVKNGFTGTRMQAIADKAEINKAMLHYYFRSKEKLYREIVQDILNTMVPRFLVALKGSSTFWEKVERLVESHISTLLEYPDIPFFIMFELSQQRQSFVEELRKRAGINPIQSLIESMMEEIEKGNIRQVNPIQFFLSLNSLSVFPFMAKPIICTVAEIPEATYEALMKERVDFIMDFLKHALRPD